MKRLSILVLSGLVAALLALTGCESSANQAGTATKIINPCPSIEEVKWVPVTVIQTSHFRLELPDGWQCQETEEHQILLRRSRLASALTGHVIVWQSADTAQTADAIARDGADNLRGRGRQDIKPFTLQSGAGEIDAVQGWTSTQPKGLGAWAYYYMDLSVLRTSSTGAGMRHSLCVTSVTGEEHVADLPTNHALVSEVLAALRPVEA